jgi:hypothetical protein
VAELTVRLRRWFTPFRTMIGIAVVGVGVWRLYEAAGTVPAVVMVAVAALIALFFMRPGAPVH